MIDFLSIYHRFEQELKANAQTLIEVAKELSELKDLQNRDSWYKALAVCIQAKEQGVLQHEFFSQVSAKMFDVTSMQFSSIMLDQSNYEQWFNLSVELCEALLETGNIHANTFLFSLYSKTRYTYINVQLAQNYLIAGFQKGDLNAKAYYGKALLTGDLIIDKDTSLGEQYLSELVQENHPLGIFFLCNYKFNNCNSAQEALEVLESFGIDVLQDTESNYNLADYYLREAQDQTALNILEHGVAKNLVFSKYLKGMVCINGRFLELGCSVEQGYELLRQAFEQGIFLSGHVLAMNYLYPQNPEFENKELGMFYLELCSKYNVNESLVCLALELLSNQTPESTQKALEYLDRAIDNGSAKAYLEKAILILEGEVLEKDQQLAITLLEKAVDLGSVQALFQFGFAYHNTQIYAEDAFQKALHYFELAAELGHLDALEYSARYYSQGVGVEIDLQKSIAYYQQAIDIHDSNFSKVELATLYFENQGNEQEINMALELLFNAIDKEYWYAAYRLGTLYESDLLAEPDMEKAFEFYQLAASYDISAAVYQVARFNRYGLAGQSDEVLALSQFHHALELGLVDANVDIALAYEEGTCGVEQDFEKALEYMLQGANAGIAYAQYKVGYYYLYGSDTLQADVELGKYWLEQAVEQASALAMLTLGDFYLYGYDQDSYHKAFSYYDKAKDLGWISEGIGVCCQFGIGTEVDEKQAFNYYKQASERQYAAATSRLAQAYFFGIGCQEDKEQAFHYFKELADQGMVEAMDYLGPMLLKGEGCQKDPELAVFYLQQAAEQQYNTSQYVLGNCYLQGLGVEQSDEIALQWYQSAAENGNEEASKIIGGPRKRRR